MVDQAALLDTNWINYCAKSTCCLLECAMFRVGRCFLFALTLAGKKNKKNNPGMFMVLGSWDDTRRRSPWLDLIGNQQDSSDSEPLKYSHCKRGFLLHFLSLTPSPTYICFFFGKLKAAAAWRRNKCTHRNFLTRLWLSRQVFDNNSLCMWWRVDINDSNQRVHR